MADPREELRRRITWFYETQLRRLNLESFREVRPDQPGPLLDLISESTPTLDFSRPGAGRMVDAGWLYLDSELPVWTNDEAARHGKFADTLLGRLGDWLNAVPPQRLAAALLDLSDSYHAQPTGSILDRVLPDFARTRPVPNPDNPADPRVVHTDDGVGKAISRAELAATKPWLIPELYNGPFDDVTIPSSWVTNLEHYLAEYEAELALLAGKPADPLPFTIETSGAYRKAISSLMASSSAPSAGRAVTVRLVDLSKAKPEDESETYVYRHAIGTIGSPLGPVADFSLSDRVKYWSGVIYNSLKECVALKANSDMGLCQLIRITYRYGALPDRMAPPTELRWRSRKPPDRQFDDFVAARAADPRVSADPDLSDQLRAATTKLRIILEESAAHPHSPDPSFSPLAGEILRHGLTSYKFWLDEHPRALDNATLNKLKSDLDYGDDQDKEMEFWSENHYIMFASSEYLLGQLWADSTFQPMGLVATDATGARSGESRRQRGRARLLKWLNNRLMFGWMEFNSSGYYREHLWALLNLVDFALDDEIRTKATMAVDLLLFDAIRFSHCGSMGAAGGRSQFSSKSHGFDNGLTDVIEMLLGVKGLYKDADAEIGASFASSTYEVPQVLLEIGSRPPAYPYTDRSRVSITFDEAPKYAIGWSQKSEAKNSVHLGYASKRAQYSAFLSEVNTEIERTHENYLTVHDDTIFFWGMSAFYNKQIIRNTLTTADVFGLNKSPIFGMIQLVLQYILPIFKASEGGFLGIRPSDVIDTIGGMFGGYGPDELDEQSADDLSALFEGQARTRANIVTYRCPGAMLSTIQNFHTGQLNFQSSIQQATLSATVNVFVTTGFAGLDISDLAMAAAGFVGGAVLWPVGGAIAGVVINHEAIRGVNPLGGDGEDGPDWWTGYWALPRTVQHKSAAIMISEFNDMQDFLAETGSHAWFPQSGFDQWVERRCSAYDDANFPLLDIGHIGAKGFWLFGKVVHDRPPGSLEPPEEGYIGVFSNKRPDWLTKEDDPYELRLEKASDGPWQNDPDLFAGRDWYVNGKNIWIIQVGSRSEFGSFQAFMDRVSSARVHIDDTYDMECTYDVPLPGGGSDRLRLTWDGDFELNGGGLQIDRFPRFENPFVRGGLVEWGQREYVMEWNGASLLHDFSAFTNPVREAAPQFSADDRDTIRALVIHLRTGDVPMDAFTVATATVSIGCIDATANQVIAAGPASEDSDHDAEWIFFDRPLRRSVDQALTVHHPPSSDDDEPSWSASFTVKALMGDRRLVDCTAAFSSLHFEDRQRSSGPRPFTVRLSRWAPWNPVGGAVAPVAWLLAGYPSYRAHWQDHHDLLALDREGTLWHRRMSCGGTNGFWQALEPVGAAPLWPLASHDPASAGPGSAHRAWWTAFTDVEGRTHVFAINGGRLLARSSEASGHWRTPWVDLAPVAAGVFGPQPVPLGPGSSVTMAAKDNPIWPVTTDLYVTGADGDVYRHPGWRPDEPTEWQRLITPEFEPAPGRRPCVVGPYLIALATQGTLWIRPREPVLFGGGWQPLPNPPYAVGAFAAVCDDDVLHLATRGPLGQVHIGIRHGEAPVAWQATRADDSWTAARQAELAWVSPRSGEAWLFATGVDGTIRGLTIAEPVWRSVGAEQPPSGPGASVAAACRAEGQLEVFSQPPSGQLRWAWWA